MEKCSTHRIKVNLKSQTIPFLLPSMLGRKPEFQPCRLWRIFMLLFGSVPTFNHHCGGQLYNTSKKGWTYFPDIEQISWGNHSVVPGLVTCCSISSVLRGWTSSSARETLAVYLCCRTERGRTGTGERIHVPAASVVGRGLLCDRGWPRDVFCPLCIRMRKHQRLNKKDVDVNRVRSPALLGVERAWC